MYLLNPYLCAIIITSFLFERGAGRGSVLVKAILLPLLFPILLITHLYLICFSSLLLFLLLRKSPLQPDRRGNYTSVRLRAIRSLPGNAPCGVDNNGY